MTENRDPNVCEWFACTALGDRLTTLQKGYYMSFKEKVLWSEQAASMFAHSQVHDVSLELFRNDSANAVE